MRCTQLRRTARSGQLARMAASLMRDADLIVVAIRDPALDLLAARLAGIQQHVERMMDVVGGSLPPQLRLELLAAPGCGSARAHRAISMPSRATSTPRRSSSRASSEDSFRIGFVLLMWIKIFAHARGQAAEPFEHAALAALGEMAEVAGALLRDTHANHLVVAPERTVDEHARGSLHAFEQPLVDRTESRGIHGGMAAAAVLEDEGHVVAGNGRGAVRRIRRGLARHRQRAPAEHPAHLSTMNGRSSSMRRRSTPQKCGEHSEHGIAVGQVGIGAVRAPDRPRAAWIRAACRAPSCDRPVRRPGPRRRARCRAARDSAADPGEPAIAPRMSGEALTSTQRAGSRPLTAMEDCVRGRARRVPARKPAQFGQLQFHWGKPPPAADPRMRIFTEEWAPPRLRARALSTYQRLATYMVISMPNRNSVACGVSHFMRLLQKGSTAPCSSGPRPPSIVAIMKCGS